MGKTGTIWQFFRALFPSTWRTLSPNALFTRLCLFFMANAKLPNRPGFALLRVQGFRGALAEMLASVSARHSDATALSVDFLPPAPQNSGCDIGGGAKLGGSLVGVWCWNIQISEPAIWQKSLFLRNFRDFPEKIGP